MCVRIVTGSVDAIDPELCVDHVIRVFIKHALKIIFVLNNEISNCKLCVIIIFEFNVAVKWSSYKKRRYSMHDMEKVEIE